MSSRPFIVTIRDGYFFNNDFPGSETNMFYVGYKIIVVADCILLGSMEYEQNKVGSNKLQGLKC